MKLARSIIIALLLTSCQWVPEVAITEPSIATVAPATGAPTNAVESLTPIDEFLPTPAGSKVALREANPEDWNLIYEGWLIWVRTSPDGAIWIARRDLNTDGSAGTPGLARFDGHGWTYFSGADYGFHGGTSDIAIGNDGTVWITDERTLSRYQNGQWDTFSIPDLSERIKTYLAVDPSEAVWLSNALNYGDSALKRFDGTQWTELPLPDLNGSPYPFLFTSDGTLWGSFGWPVGIGKYDGQKWTIYAGLDLWPRTGMTDPISNIQVAKDTQDNVYVMYYSREDILRIDPEGAITRIPLDDALELRPELLRIYSDDQGTIWINACNASGYPCLAYYQNNKWNVFTNLPFRRVLDFAGSGKVIYMATEKGLYQFTPTE